MATPPNDLLLQRWRTYVQDFAWINPLYCDQTIDTSMHMPQLDSQFQLLLALRSFLRLFQGRGRCASGAGGFCGRCVACAFPQRDLALKAAEAPV